MQKPQTGRGATHVQRKGTVPTKERISFSFSNDQQVTTSKSFLLVVEGTTRPSLDDAFANLSTSSSHLFYQRPATKIPNNGLVTIKTPYNGLNNCN